MTSSDVMNSVWELSRRLRRLTLVMVTVGCLAMLSACNTTEGVGRDVEDLGEGIQDIAN